MTSIRCRVSEEEKKFLISMAKESGITRRHEATLAKVQELMRADDIKVYIAKKWPESNPHHVITRIRNNLRNYLPQ